MRAIDVVFAWIMSDPAYAIAITVWVFANVAPRPNPRKLKGAQRVLWTLVDRMCILTAERLPGRFKWLLAGSPVAAEQEKVSPATTKDTTP